MSLPTDFFLQNTWANRRLIEVCRDLTDEQLDAAPVNGVFGSIRGTFAHIVSSELWYARLLGQDVQPWDDETEAWPGWDAVDGMVQRAGAALAAAAEQPPEGTIRSTSGRWDIDPAVVLIQMYHHGTDHRSQISTVLTALGIDPPDLSSWSWGQDTDRMTPVED